MYKNKTWKIVTALVFLMLILLLTTSCKLVKNKGNANAAPPPETKKNIIKTPTPASPSQATPNEQRKTPITTPTPIPTPALPQRPKIKIFLLENVNTCIVGSECTGSDCINVKNIATDDVVRSFNRNGLVGKAPEQLSSDERNSAYCLNLKFNQNEIDSVKNEVYSFRDKIIEYGQNRIIPDIQIIEIDNGEGV
ncbi:hypothetical protein HYX00_06310, partial [Candidatus Woesearchaeota archaeon]|nr:hypothetical protein [Candidatus Woesearchaeota archaeon]